MEAPWAVGDRSVGNGDWHLEDSEPVPVSNSALESAEAFSEQADRRLGASPRFPPLFSEQASGRVGFLSEIEGSIGPGARAGFPCLSERGGGGDRPETRRRAIGFRGRWAGACLSREIDEPGLEVGATGGCDEIVMDQRKRRRLRESRVRETGSVWLPRAPRTERHLETSIRQLTGVSLADQAVCRGHDAPRDYFSKIFLERPPLVLVLGPRGGGKSFLSRSILI